MLAPFGRLAGADSTFFKCVALAVALSPMTGCYAYTLPSSAIQPGSDVRLETRQGGRDVAFLFAQNDTVRIAGVKQLEGQVVSADQAGMLVRLGTLSRFAGSSDAVQSVSTAGTTTLFQTSRSVAFIPMTSVSNGHFDLTRRQLSKGRTAALVGGITALTFAVVAIAAAATVESIFTYPKTYRSGSR